MNTKEENTLKSVAWIGNETGGMSTENREKGLPYNISKLFPTVIHYK
jgi:hypothetical protein